MITWLKKNLLVVILIVIIVFLATDRLIRLSPSAGSRIMFSNGVTGAVSMVSPSGGAFKSSPKEDVFYSADQVAPVETSNRLVIQNTSLSLVVNDVSKTINQIEIKAKELGGFLVNSNLNKPEMSASGSISVRVPEDKRAEALTAFKGLAVKVVSENINGTDVTDQYVDLEERLKVLNTTKEKFEAILDKADLVTDILSVQRELINLQSQIDSLKGQQKYYEQSAKLTLIQAYLSTDELALPYTPDKSWRPAVVFKEAVRSLIYTFRNAGNSLIWVFVYAPIWLPVIILLWLLRRKLA